MSTGDLIAKKSQGVSLPSSMPLLSQWASPGRVGIYGRVILLVADGSIEMSGNRTRADKKTSGARRSLADGFAYV